MVEVGEHTTKLNMAEVVAALAAEVGMEVP